jgi:cytochrome c oxidase accessory protein FixG
MANLAELKPPRARAAPAAGDEVQQSLYAKRQKIYAREVHGMFAGLRIAAVVVLLGIYYGLPWLEWGGRQAVLFDLPARKFYLFGLVLWPQDFFYLAVLLIISAYALFFFTALAGRLWCGYACPQTVWTEVFMWIERRIEGDRPKQMRLDKGPWTREKVLKKGATQLTWLLLSAYTGFTFVGYFTPIQELGGRILALDLGPWETFWVVFYSLATYGNAGWMREQVCIYMCPYARFQSAMFDRDTLVISYDEARGEPRGSRAKSADAKALGLGDCIDCTMCVQVCPTGIDIRNGLQYQCIGCAACIDVCDDVMEKMGYPKGLVRYTTESALAGQPTHLLRPRVLVYATILVTLVAGLVYAVSQRVPLELDIIRDRANLYRETDEGLVENVYELKIINMDERDHVYRLAAGGLEGLSLVGGEGQFRVPAGEVYSVPIQLRIDPANLKGSSWDVTITLASVDEPTLTKTEKTRFMGPRL